MAKTNLNKKMKCEHKNLKQLCLLNQDILENMTYQSIGIIRIVDDEKDNMVRKFNYRIVRNYILSAVLGGLVVGGVLKGPEVVAKAKEIATQKIVALSQSR